MGRFVIGLCIGLMVGLVFANSIFPDGFNAYVEHWGQDVRNHIPGR